MVLGSNPSGSSSSVRSVAGQDAGDGFVYGSPSMTFETMVIGTKACAAKPAKATKTKPAKAKLSKVAKPPKAVKPPRVFKHSVPSRKPISSPSSRALRPEGSPPSRGKTSSAKTSKKHSDSASQVLDPPFTAPAVQVDSSLDPCDVTAQWVQDYTDYHGPRPAAEAEEEDDEVLSEGNLSDASATSGSTKWAGSKHSSLTHAPPVQSDDGAGAEEADDSAGSAAEDEESPDESVSKPPRAAIRLDVLATVATTSK
ncbi:hypothetical protein PF006_g14657 [Phytophthora fragariae]|uniref:Uncharacterized protein n=1 Tax=Phytophthora fragariae TaxID=53985 RepID=A0A6A3TFV5_9STRA|nr:hypothetical protein PF006_g14657 [Phytophthora fragariae]